MMSSMGHRTCTPTMLFVVLLWFAPIFSPKFKFNVLVLLIMAPLKDRSWPPGPQFETIRYLVVEGLTRRRRELEAQVLAT